MLSLSSELFRISESRMVYSFRSAHAAVGWDGHSLSVEKVAASLKDLTARAGLCVVAAFVISEAVPLVE